MISSSHESENMTAHPYGGVQPQYTPQELAAALGGNQPTPQQAEVIAASLAPKLVVAGAGSGKTATMVDRVVWLVANGIVAPQQVLGVTFTRKAAGELRDRVRGRLSVLRSKGLIAQGSGQESEALILEPTVMTYHSYASSLVREYGLRIGVEPETMLLGQAQAWQMVRALVERWDGEVRENFNAATLTRQVMELSAGAAEHLLPPERIHQYLAQYLTRLSDVPPVGRSKSPGEKVKKAIENMERTRILTDMVRKFLELKKEQETMDFGDLLSYAAQIAEHDATAQATERQRFAVVLLDEFQDTSHAQMTLFSSLFSGGHSVMAVGDPQQSIYGFRGASAGQLFSFHQWFPPGPGHSSRPGFLTTAWRNDTNILAAANTIAEPLRTPPVWAVPSSGLEKVPELESRPGAADGVVEIARYLTDSQEAAAVARSIQGLMDHASQGEVPPTVAVLCRRRAQFEPVRRELAAHGIAYEVVGLGGLLEVPEVTDLVATLQVLTDPGRSDALARLLTGPRWRIGARDMVALGDWASHLERQRTRAAQRGVLVDELADIDDVPTAPGGVAEPDSSEVASLVEALETLPPEDWVSAAGRSLSRPGRERMVRCAEELHTLRSWLSEDLVTVLTVVERTLGLDLEIAARPSANNGDPRRNLDALHDLALRYSASTGSEDVGAFLAWLEVAQEEENLDAVQSEPQPGAVQILTIHASKGLEWDYVYVPGMNADNAGGSRQSSAWTKNPQVVPWPLRGDHHYVPQWAADTTDVKELKDSMELFLEDVDHFDQDELRRLMYVAFTRARHGLSLSSSIFSGTNKSAKKPSIFMDELEPLTQPTGQGAPVISRGFWAQDEPGQENPAGATVLEAAWPYDPLEGPGVTEITAYGAPEEKRLWHPPVHQGRREHLMQVAQAVANGGFVDFRDYTDADLRKDPQVRRWHDEAQVLLARHQNPPQVGKTPTPTHVSASTVVELGKDPDAVADQLRRPMPRRPSVAARAGTTFHTWVEQYFESHTIFDREDLPDGADSFVDQGYDLPQLIRTFRDSPWAHKQPWALEYPFETPLGGVSVRGRIDAVFRTPDDGWELVDWKSGRAPGPQEITQRSVQLAVYRLAWSRLMGVDLEDISAAFYFVGSDRTVRPHDMATEQQLEALVSGYL